MERIKAIEEKFFAKRDGLKTTKQKLIEMQDAQKVQTKKLSTWESDANLSYPSYGRGMDPRADLDSYMINQYIYGTAKGKSPSPRKKRNGGIDLDIGGGKPKVMSPRRLQYETKFEKFLVTKYVDDPLKCGLSEHQK